MILYHGTDMSSAFDIWKNGINLSKSKPNLDFGPGFYMTDDIDLAVKRAYKVSFDDEKPYVVKIKLNDNIWDEVKVKQFDNSDIEWAHFIACNRLNYSESDNNIDCKYDVVSGNIADGNLVKVLRSIRDKNDILLISEKDFLTTNNKSLGLQISVHTPLAISYTKVISCTLAAQM